MTPQLFFFINFTFNFDLKDAEDETNVCDDEHNDSSDQVLITSYNNTQQNWIMGKLLMGHFNNI